MQCLIDMYKHQCVYKHELEFSGNLQFENIHILHLVQTNTVVLFKIKNVLHIVGTAQWLGKWQNKIKQNVFA